MGITLNKHLTSSKCYIVQSFHGLAVDPSGLIWSWGSQFLLCQGICESYQVDWLILDVNALLVLIF